MKTISTVARHRPSQLRGYSRRVRTWRLYLRRARRVLAACLRAAWGQNPVDLLNDRMLRDIGLRRVQAGHDRPSWITDN